MNLQRLAGVIARDELAIDMENVMPNNGTKIILTGVHGNKLVADSWGNSSDPTVVFLHGGGQTRHAWGGSAARVAAAGWHAVSVDLRGHGESDWTDDYGHKEFGGDVICLAEQLGGAPVLVGASLGGISALVAQDTGTAGSGADAGQGNVCRAIVLVDIAPRSNPEGVDRIVSFMKNGVKGFATLEDAGDAVAEYMRERTRPKDVSGLRKNLRQREDGRWYWHWDPRFLNFTPKQRQESAGVLEAAASRLKIPTLLVRGGKSDVLTTEGVDAFRRLVPHARFIDVAGAGHMVAGDKNDVFTNAVLSFVGELEPVATE